MADPSEEILHRQGHDDSAQTVQPQYGDGMRDVFDFVPETEHRGVSQAQNFNRKGGVGPDEIGDLLIGEIFLGNQAHQPRRNGRKRWQIPQGRWSGSYWMLGDYTHKVTYTCYTYRQE